MPTKRKKQPPNIKPEHQYERFPALAAYIRRIDAEQLNFNRFMVKEHQGNYYTEKAVIKIINGEIYCANKEYAPTEEEAQLIKGALLEANFPKSIGARNTNELKNLLPPDAEIYRFIDRSLPKSEGNIIMVQQRVQNDDGTKNYFAWSFWSDGEWRRMEPEGELPFWKPETKLSNMIMVHEGAKAAQYVHSLVNDPSRRKEFLAHPWFETLRKYEHWGIIGGALAPHRAKYKELWDAKPTEVAYVCDNDWSGKNVLQEFSQHYGGKLKGIRFDKRWKHSWDMADEMPPEMFSGKLYLGPRLEDLMSPATWATEVLPLPAGKKGKGATICRRQFREEWFHSIQSEVFIHHDWPNVTYSDKEFNSKVAPYSNVDDTARLLRRDDVSKSTVIQYDPSRAPGIHEDSEIGRFINTYCPSHIRPLDGSAQKFLDFTKHLVPVEKDRNELLRWCATLIAKPEIKMQYGVLLMSEMQGVGKTTLGEKILAPLVGWFNVSVPSETEIVDSNFNYWIAHKRLAVVNEIYAGASGKAYNRLKTVITDQHIQVMKKFVTPYRIQNWIHIFACSNSKRALQIATDDRRWLVPAMTEEKKSQQFWEDFGYWLQREGGLGKIAHWANEFLKEQPFVAPGQEAPRTSAKDEAIEAGLSSGLSLVAEFLDRLKEDAAEGEKLIIVDTDLVELIRTVNYDGRADVDRLEKPMTVRKIAKHKGWFVNDTRIQLPGKENPLEWRQVKFGSRLVVNDPELVEKGPADLIRMGLKPTKVVEKWNHFRRL